MNMGVSCRVPRPRRCACASAPGPASRTCAQPFQTVRRTGDGMRTWYLPRCKAKAPRGATAGQLGRDRHDL
jgi:hypothetical protein